MTANKLIVFYKFLHNDNTVPDEYFLMAFIFLQTHFKNREQILLLQFLPHYSLVLPLHWKNCLKKLQFYLSDTWFESWAGY
jgi:hypothetical protein